MKTLIAEDDLTSRILLQEILKRYGPVHAVENGREAVDAVSAAMKTGEPFDLICLDIAMPEMDGYEALRVIRALERSRAIVPSECAKIFMVTALGEVKNVIQAFRECDAYLLKPIDRGKLLERLREVMLIG